MAPIEHDLSNSNRLPIALGTAYLLATSYLVYTIAHRVLYKAHTALPPSQATRFREGARRKHIGTFVGLASLSMTFAIYYGYQFLKLSYQIWAFERGDIVPTGIWGEHGALWGDSKHLQLGRWLHDTDILSEVWEIAMEKTRRRWWTQQLLLTTAPWSLYVAIQGRRHNIPHLWAFIALAGTTSLSLAMNFFFLAVLWTPVPIAETNKTGSASSTLASPKHGRKASKSIKEAADKATAKTESLWTRVSTFINSYVPPKSVDWVPHTLVYIVPLLMIATNVILLTLATNTPSFKRFLRDTFIDTTLPLILPRIVPLKAGSSSSSEATARSRALTAFRTTSIVSTIIYVLQTFFSLLDSDPGAHRHRHSLLYFHLDAERSKSARTRSAVSRVLGSLADHPSVGRVGWDALLCGISLAAWASIRAVEPRGLLRAAGWATKSELEVASEVKTLVTKEVKQIMQSATGKADEEEPTPKKKGRKRAGTKTKTADEDDVGEKGEGAANYKPNDSSAPSSPRLGTQGDEETEVEWENGAMAWGMMVMGGLATGAASVLGAEIGI
ncbi:hypothetical protein MMC10_006486 [Thelotrema lepadinum]|nr:hypothetical protein [Thelotrema lepadinum]